MGRNTRKRRTSPVTKALAGAAALALGGGGLVWANFYASAHEPGPSQHRTRAAGAQIATIKCPDVGHRLGTCPGGRAPAWTGSWRDWTSRSPRRTPGSASTRQAQSGDPDFVRNAILGPLKSQRSAALERIGTDISAGWAAPPRRAWAGSPGARAWAPAGRTQPVRRPTTFDGSAERRPGTQRPVTTSET
ncbi:hypothetical protein SFUMM280S_00503 [Streptomyces fumanus]